MIRVLTLCMIASALAAQPVMVQLRSAHGPKVVEMPLERYVADVLAGESSVFQSAEALKAMAVAARTYAVKMRRRHASEGFDFCDTTHCQRLDPHAVTARLKSAVDRSAGELLWYQGKLAFTPYSRNCGGRTEDAGALWPELAAPYLKSHDDSYCVRAGRSNWHWSGTATEVAAALRQSGLRAPERFDGIAILDRTPSGRAATLLLTGSESVRISAGPFRLAVGRAIGWNAIRSDRYSARAANGRVIFEGSGSGHGAGLCQDGAEQMGLVGKSYREILQFYYPGTVAGLTGSGLSWQRLGGESITLWTTQPDQDRGTLAAAERLAKGAVKRTGFPMPRNIELRVYPDVESFRNATGEPGWVAARTSSRRIDLQPAAVLRARNALDSTLSHESLHVLVESQAGPALPLWFREGLVNYLAGERGSAAARAVPDQELRQTGDPGAARHAYDESTAMVRVLASHYGETTVLGWVRRGLPPEVAKANSSQPATKSK